jgi:orotidine-5'-phosphate decarboxylase
MPEEKSNNKNRIIVALDFSSEEKVMELVEQLDPDLCKLKVGKELFTLAGPELVKSLTNQGFDVFLDLKYHDIPNTVANACKVAADLGVWMMNVHALGGKRMMEAAREAVESNSSNRPLLIAVTILTSMDQEELNSIGLQGSPEDNVLRLANLAYESTLDGVVCSPRETELLRSKTGSDFLLVTPGIRPADSSAGDQRRIMTPEDAIKSGSDYLVIGRPITQSENPLLTLQKINKSIAG